MSDILKEIGGYPEDASVIMSKRVVADVVDEIARLRVERDELRAELAAKRKEFASTQKTLVATWDRADKAEAELAAERDKVRELLALARPYVGQADGLLADRIDAALKGDNRE